MNEKIINIMIVDDHPLVRYGIKTLLEGYDELNLIAEAENGKEALELCEKYSPDIVLMDMVMPVLDGAETTSRLLKKWPDIKIIALTSFNEKDLIKKSLKAGAKNYILKNVSGEKLVKTIKDVYKDEINLTSKASKILLSEYGKKYDKKIKLSGREKEILSLLVEGLPNKEIAKRLFLSNSTIQFHVSNILSKLGVSKRTEAVYVALKKKLLELPG
jgi:two-component system, NarL family, response regulator LiaR